MMLGDLDSYMSAQDYILAAKEKDKKYGVYVERSIIFATSQLSNLNEALVGLGRGEYEAEIRIKNSDIINSEVSPYAFYINSGVFNVCYRMNLSKYEFLFKDNLIKKVIANNPVELPFSFVMHHELSHLYRAHNEVVNIDTKKPSFVKGTEMDADLLAVSQLYRSLQNNFKNFAMDDQELRGLF